MENEASKKKKDYSGIISIIIVTIILIFGIVFTIIALNGNSDSIIQKPEVSAYVGTDNPKMFTVKISFEGNIPGLEAMSMSKYELIVSEALNSIGYEKLTEKESINYIKEEVKKRITEELKPSNPSEFNISSVYVDKFTETKYVPQEKDKKGKTNPNNPSSTDIANMFKKK